MRVDDLVMVVLRIASAMRIMGWSLQVSISLWNDSGRCYCHSGIVPPRVVERIVSLPEAQARHIPWKSESREGEQAPYCDDAL